MALATDMALSMAMAMTLTVAYQHVLFISILLFLTKSVTYRVSDQPDLGEANTSKNKLGQCQSQTLFSSSFCLCCIEKIARLTIVPKVKNFLTKIQKSDGVGIR